jgi:amino acid adenylation domain-containing protein
MPRQLVREVEPSEISIFDVSGRRGERPLEAALRLADDLARRPFDLTRDRLFRIDLARLSDREHVLFMSTHHLAADGWSMGILVTELAQLYSAFVQGRGSPLDEPQLQYADFVLWQNEWLRSQEAEAQLAYWKSQLADAPSTPLLPTSSPRTAAPRFDGARATRVLRPALAAALVQASARASASLFMTLLAAFECLLFRYSRQTDLVVGCPIANRHRPERESLVGFFVNLLPLRVRLSGRLSFHEVLARVRDVAVEAYGHQDFPFDEMVDAIRPDRGGSNQPLVQMVFVVQEKAPEVVLPGLLVERLDLHDGTSKFDLLISIEPGGDSMKVICEYRTDLLPAATIEALLAHYEVLLEAVVAHPHTRIDRLPLLTATERARLLPGSATPITSSAGDSLLHSFFERQVRRTPEAIAAVFDHQVLTYRELNAQADRLARRLRNLGVSPEQRIGVCLHRHLGLLVGVLGVLKAGAVLVPLPSDHPPERLAQMVANAQPKLVIATEATMRGLPAGLSWIPPEPEVQSTEATETEPAHVDPENLAYVIYTSGSTGKPKGIGMPHRAIANLITWQITNTTLPPAADTLQFASLGFDVSLQELFLTWATGGAVHLVSERVRSDPAALWDRIRAAKISRVFLPFVYLQQLAEVAATRGRTGIREFFIGGEPLQITPAIRALVGERPDSSLHNHYGPSECHVVTDLTLRPPTRDWPELPSIGRPVDNVELLILDAEMEPVPIGVPGEIYLGGVQVARGYWNAPDLTAQSFVPHPFGRPGERLYRTGDIASLAPEGQIRFLGRVDLQVKVQGVRVEIAEVEAALRDVEGVADAAVLLVEAPHGPSKQLVACLVAKPGASLTVRGLREAAGHRLTPSMLPSRFHLLAQLPLDPNGKVDRRKLAASELPPLHSGSGPAAALTGSSQLLAQLWSEVLHHAPIGPDDNFFEIGGSSLLMLEVHRRLPAAFGRSVPLIELYRHPTIRALADYLDGTVDQTLAGRARRPPPADRSSITAQREARRKARSQLPR